MLLLLIAINMNFLSFRMKRTDVCYHLNATCNKLKHSRFVIATSNYREDYPIEETWYWFSNFVASWPRNASTRAYIQFSAVARCKPNNTCTSWSESVLS